MNATPRALESLSEEELAGVSTLWKREQRKLVTSFNGSSMLPAITPGQQVLIECGVDPVVGNVVAFQRQNLVGVHRLVACTATWLLTWGDANTLPDEPIERKLVIGVIRDTTAAPRSLYRTLLLWLLAPPRAPVDVLTRRVRLAHRVRAAWLQGPSVFVRKSLRVLLCKKLPCRTP